MVNRRRISFATSGFCSQREAGAKTRAATNSMSNGLLIPATGFAPGKTTMLPAQPADKPYSALSNLRLEIPSLGLDMPVVGVMLKDGSWDVSWLGNNAGYLEGSAYPTRSGNSILTGHVTDVNGDPGPFASIRKLSAGDKVQIHSNGLTYVYEVRENHLVSPGNIKTLFQHEDYEWLTLVTCESYNVKLDKFVYRRMVRAVLISVIPGK